MRARCAERGARPCGCCLLVHDDDHVRSDTEAACRLVAAWLQFFLDQATQTLYFYPPTPLAQWTEGPFITQELFAMNVSGTSHVTLRGLGIHHSRGNGLLAFNVTGVRIEDCEISGHGQHGAVSYVQFWSDPGEALKKPCMLPRSALTRTLSFR